jgi:predicted glycosyltransferase
LNGAGIPLIDGRRRRIALYSHDTMGLGHTRRNMLIANALANATMKADVLLVTGATESNAFAMPPAVDLLTLPALRKNEDGCYQSRRLDLSLRDLTALRGETIRAALLAFDPDVLIVDNVPRGAARELDPALAALRATGRTRIVLGLRDVLDEPSVIAEEWERAENFQALRDFYDAIWVYGDPRVYDTVKAYNFPCDIAVRVSYTGYLDARQRHGFSEAESDAAVAALDLPPGRLALGMVGGGQDGEAVASAFVRARFPDDMNAVLVTGPYMPEAIQRQLHEAAAGNPRLRVLDFLPEPTLLLSRADRVVGMGGYNTVAELMAFETPALIIPRVCPRREQWVRAEQLRALGLVDVLHPDHVSPSALSEWLAADLPATTSARSRVDLGGLDRLPHLVQQLLATPSPIVWTFNIQSEGEYVHVA